MAKFFKHPWVIVGVIAAGTVFFGVQLTRARLDNNNLRFLPDGNEARIISDYIEETFGPATIMMVGFERPYGTVFEPEFLSRLKEFTEVVEGIEYTKSVTSIMSTSYITGEGDAIVADDLVPEDFSGTREEIARLKQRLASWDLYQGALVSDDFQATQAVITLDVLADDSGDPAVIASMDEIRDRARAMFDGLATVYVTGMPVISAAINDAALSDIAFLVPLVVLVVLGVLFFSFRRFTFVTLTLITVLVAVVWTIGAMPLFGIKLSILSAVLPIILVAVGSAYGIHVVTHYAEDTRGRALSREEHASLVFALMGKLLKPVFLAALTTFAGFVSFCFTPIVPMREFGIFASVGVLLSFAAAVTLIPALLLIRGPKAHTAAASGKAAAGKGEKRADRTGAEAGISAFFLGIARRRKVVLALTGVVVVVSVIGLSRIIVDSSAIEFFRGETEISLSDTFIRTHFGGSRELTLLVEADTTEALLDPAVLSAVDNMASYLVERVEQVGKVAGFVDVIKRMNQVFNVGESPAGLSLSGGGGVKGADEEDFGFGFDDEEGFGFGDFGFAQSAGGDAGETEAPAVASAGPEYITFDLLNTAIGRHPGMNANELVKELERETNYEGYAYYEVPADPARYGKSTPEELQRLVANYLVLLAGDSDDSYANDPLEPTVFKTTIQLRTTGSRDTQQVMNIIQKYIDDNFPDTVRVSLGGSATTESAVTNLIVGAQIISVVISVLVVLVIVALSYHALSAGLIAAAPLAIAIMCNFAVMGFLGVTLNIGTAIIASLAVGIGIDYTIHFIDFYKREYAAGGGEKGDDFLRRTFSGCGKAILINAVSVGAGFGVLALSSFKMLAELGALIALSMVITALVSLTVIPVLLTTAKPKFIYGRN